ncbi:DUF2185 domain-containing protein [Pseudoflavonifractor sp. AF19-9AC]|uniref:immunity protein Imm33 domain-containing protein n=1 Tax=Pseudoflavonifractor sp. AF19-9AC TaxID=2292244 RepID=UPI000E52D1F7|nr:DUF2185 domain-containing protein [Pseudoflavonifractor sp. AF19-9AC]RHR10055.1 DUF2185 domain-containing protein [Pseudoflavonifractor sp. AF19-9AC]
MNQILKELRAIAGRERARCLPEVTDQDLEKNGALFYMNGQNGTEFDWYVNDRLSSFMVFYNDEANLGAVKLHLSHNGTADVFLYGEQGKKLLKQETVPVEATEQELLELAVLLRCEADDKRLWDADIETLNTDDAPEPAVVAEFRSRQGGYTAMRDRRILLDKRAMVSKKILDEGWKVGYMERVEPHDAEDSGWFFASGTEEQGYLDDYRNIQLLPVGVVWQQLDRDIFAYIDRPVGTRLIRTASDQFDVDRLDQEIYTVKR